MVNLTVLKIPSNNINCKNENSYCSSGNLPFSNGLLYELIDLRNFEVLLCF